ncbi:MAG: ABC transporter permease [Chloracidobacterium sp.]|nr:ABC transporter permease [Chloracidobacterium sp.]
MTWLRVFIHRLHGMFFKRKLDQDLEEEIRSHLEMQIEENLRQGMTPEEAREAASCKFGGVLQVKEAYRDRLSLPAVETAFQDLRYGLRTLRHNPCFTFVAVLALALGLGAAAKIFGLVNTLLVHPLPYPNADRLAQVVRRMQSGQANLSSYPRFRFIQGNSRAFESMAAYDAVGSGLTAVVGDSPNLMRSLRVSGDFFHVLAVQPFLGRSITAADDQPGAAPVAVLSHRAWVDMFGGDTSEVGRSVQMSGRDYTIVGVMPSSFRFTLDADVFVPLSKSVDWSDRAVMSLITGRLRPGLTLQDAQQELNVIEQRLREEHPEAAPRSEVGMEAIGYKKHIIGDSWLSLQILAWAAACILLSACTSVANLSLTRAIARRKEIAVRIALGVSRGRIIRQLLTESITLALIGGSVGLGLAAGTLYILKLRLPTILPRISEVSVNAETLAIAFGASVVTGVIFGLAPALQLAGQNPAAVLRDSGRSSSDRRSRNLQGVLVSAEVGLATVLLLATALLLVSFQKLRSIDLGFNPSGVVTFQTSLSGLNSQSTSAVMLKIRRVLERIQSIPGVQSAATVTQLPTENCVVYRFEALPAIGDPGEALIAEWKPITPDYFKVMDIRLKSGRLFTDADDEGSARVIIVNDAFTRRFMRGNSSRGAQIVLGDQSDDRFADQSRTVVGVVGDTLYGDRRDAGYTDEFSPTVYIPTAQIPDKSMAFLNGILPMSWVVRANGDADAISAKISREIFAVDPQLVAANPRTLKELLSESIARQQMQTMVVAIFAVVALFLGIVGVYGVVAQAVAERKQEIGIRLALGASGANVALLMIRYGLAQVIPGLIVGILGSLAACKVLSSALYGIEATNISVMAGVLSVLALVSFTAVLAPALRARKVDPNLALRS